ncbi:hypothetical protein JOC36_000594 [Weissella uvarum]|uniref:hypothetical protein n=1 Tax=Weissella uvarum TaxID=1479233 RepID=UPI00195F60CB|nr:hypothetical protein [Weissella uvarum]MBM7617045.1 hypothetical protein [Weissella uvarum]MCM0595343.1 hypothetical protein [Weissella uvarum]
MQQQWWQHKLFFGLGLVGALTYVLESILGVLLWPAYQPMAYPLAILTAQGAPYRGGFLVAQVLAGLLIVIALLAVYSYHRFQSERMMTRWSGAMLLAWVTWLLVVNFWPNAKMAAYVLPTGMTVKDGVLGILIIVLAGTILGYANEVTKLTWWSLRNVLTVMALLFVLFNFLEFGMQMINWPFRGFFDILALDAIALGFGFLSWYFMRQAI